ncbi:MAG: hypothetical protein JW928_05275 [Candidatus Aureabacteria bacterium]|nr:hypothetical protein [Candidatus Auribacterota bacterium]
MNHVRLAVLDPGGMIVSSSQSFRDSFQEAFSGTARNIMEILDFDIRTVNHNRIDHAYTNIPVKNASSRTVDFFLHSLHDDQKKLLAFIMTLHESNNLKSVMDFNEENLCHIDRLTHIGKLAAGIAHEIGNPLGGILAAAHGLKKKLKDEPQKEYINMIIQDIASIKNTIESLRDFARRSKPRFVKTDLRDVLKRTLFLVLPEIQKKNVRFIERTPEAPLEINADPEQLRQVFLNILLNAVSAVQIDGQITLSISLTTRQNHKNYYLVTVRDNGPGIDADDISIIFRPFYTTKAKGLGLGLCVTKKIVEDHDGFIEVESERSKGTTFNVYLLKE